MNDNNDELQAFLDDWSDTEARSKEAFLRLKSRLAALDGVNLTFIARPGVTYSLRAAHATQSERSLFVMADVIEDDPRWLSVCFYGEMIRDPEERGDFVPQGLLGEDAVCFDVDQYDEDLLAYVEARMGEACQAAVRE